MLAPYMDRNAHRLCTCLHMLTCPGWGLKVQTCLLLQGGDASQCTPTVGRPMHCRVRHIRFAAVRGVAAAS